MLCALGTADAARVPLSGRGGVLAHARIAPAGGSGVRVVALAAEGAHPEADPEARTEAHLW